ncbi:MAG: DUF4175 family protein [bacterium]
MTPAVQLLDSLAILRRQWRTRVLLESSVWIAVAALLAVIAGQVTTSAFGTTTSTLIAARIIGYALIVVAIVRFLVMPLVKRASDERFALYVEERAPELRQALLSAIHELRLPEANRASPSLTARLVERTLVLVRPLHRGATLERPRMLRAARALGMTAVAAALLFFVGPKALRHTARQMFAPWSIAEAAVTKLAVNVKPGNAAIPRGAAVDIHAALVGFGAEGAELVLRPDTGTQWIRLPMGRDASAGNFTSRVFDLTRPTEYYVESNGVKSQVYKLSVTELPAVKQLAVDLHYPAYTGLPMEHIADGGDVAAVIGTTVNVRPSVTRAVRGGELVFDNGEKVPFKLAKDGSIDASFRVTKNRYYRIDLVSEDGATVPGSVQYAIDALPDHAPNVRIDEPGRDTKVTNIEEVTIAVSATDDYGVESMELRYQVNGGETKHLAMADSGKRHPKEQRVAHTLFLEEMKLKPGDLVSYSATARDGAGNVSSSDVYFLEVRPFGKNYRQAEQQGGGGGGGGASPGEFVARQREVVVGTFNWLRDSATTLDRKRREDITTIDIAEGRLREEVAGLARRIAERGVARADSNFRLIKTELDSAVLSMIAAEEKLVRAEGTGALSPEQKALQHLQTAEALFRDVQVQMGQQGGGGGGGGAQQKAEDLADLFELQTDKLKNQYEALPQQSQQQQAQQAVDETLNRLKELAARQQQENERLQRMAEALRDKLGKESGNGGGGGSQRDLAKQAEEEARRLERLAREQNNKDLMDAAQKMQQAADAMKRAAASGSAAQGSAAADQLKNAAKGLENASASRVNDQVKRLADQAKDLQNRQGEIAKDVKALGDATPDQRGAQIQKLNQAKDALKSDVAKLESDADRVAREGRRDQPGASGKVGNAANAIRDQRIGDKIDFSKNVIRGGSSDYANAFENQIASNLGDVADKMREAASALGSESASRGQERSLEQTRDLVKGLESLRDRTNDKAAQKGQQVATGQQGQGKQGQGQQGQQGQGQQGQGQQGQGKQGQGQQGQGQQGQGQQGKGQQGQGQQGQGQQGQGQQGQGQQGQGQQGQGQQGQGQQGQGQQGQGQGQGQQGEGQQGQGQQQGQGGGGNRFGSGRGTPNGAFSPDDARQFSREAGVRRQAAEQLRDQLRGKGVDVSELDKAIEDLKSLESGAPFVDPKRAAQLQEQMIEGLKSFEFSLYRRFGLGNDKSPTLGTNAPVPAEYRAAVEEYYRSLAGRRKP